MIGGCLILAVILFQTIVFRDRLPLFQKVEGLSMGAWSQSDASGRLEELYANSEIDMYVKSAAEPFTTVKAKDIGLSAVYDEKVNQIISPLWLRLIPSSVLWAHMLSNDSSPTYKNDEQKIDSFVTKQFGEKCKVEPKNATLSVKDSAIVTVKSSDGGECKRDEVEKTLKNAKANVQKTVSLEVPVDPIKPSISDDQAEKLKKTIEQRLGDSVNLKALDKQISIDKKTLISWLEFDATGENIVVNISQ